MVLIPSGTKSGKVFSQKPVNGDGDFTFSRSTAATRVNADGNIEKETQNFVTQSNNFNNSDWTKVRLSVTSGQSGYDGSSDAWAITGTNPADGDASHYLVQTTSPTGVLTLSAYLKANGKNWSRILFLNGSNPRADFDLANGTIHNINGGAIDANMESVGGGWYRCSVTANITASSSIYIYASDGNNDTNWVGDDTSGVLIQDAQLEQGLVARDVITTTTAAVEGGITDNVPRLDYTDSSCPALLLEPQRTNIFTQSEFIENLFIINGSGSGGSFTANYGESPEGFDNSVRVQATNTTTSHFYYAMSLTAGTQYAISCYYKGTSGEKAYLNSISTSGGVNAGKLITFNGSWQRETILFTAGTGANYVYVHDARAGGSTATDFEVFGFQVEAGSYATSYIPTYGTSVTRNADDMALLTTTSLLSQTTNNTIYGEITNFKEQAGNARFISLFSSSFSNADRILIYSGHTGSNYTLNVQYKTSGQSDVSIYKSAVSYNEKVKFAVVFDGTEMSFFVNGSLVGSSTIVAANNFYYYDPTNVFNDLGFREHQVIFIPTALTDQEAIDLTTI